MEIRMLQVDDLSAYRVIRRQALVNHPEAFGMSVAEFDAQDDESASTGLTSGLPQTGMLGAFVDGDLVGTISARRHHRTKTRHRANIGAMYVSPSVRGQGIGRQLMQAALDHFRSLGDIEQVVLAVTAGNIAARNLYRRMGFITWGVDPAYIRVGDVDHDIEWMILWLTD